MDKATRAIRRSGVRLKSMNTGHTNLALIVSGIRDMRVGLKSLQSAQSAVAQDLVTWSHIDENRAIQDVLEQLKELHDFWADSQRDFLDHLKSFKQQFELILEGERQIDVARSKVVQAEQREQKIKKELTKAAKKASADELSCLATKLSDAERDKDFAQSEALERMQENEACKLIRLKAGLSKLSESYVELAHKMAIIFEAHKEVTQAIPDVDTSAIHEMKYTGSVATKQIVQRAREKLDSFHTQKYRLVAQVATLEEPPPPYTPGFYDPATGLPYNHGGGLNEVRSRNRRTAETSAPTATANAGSLSLSMNRDYSTENPQCVMRDTTTPSLLTTANAAAHEAGVQQPSTCDFRDQRFAAIAPRLAKHDRSTNSDAASRHPSNEFSAASSNANTLPRTRLMPSAPPADTSTARDKLQRCRTQSFMPSNHSSNCKPSYLMGNYRKP